MSLESITNFAHQSPIIFWTLVGIATVIVHILACWRWPTKRCRWCEGGKMFQWFSTVFYRRGCIPLIGCGGGGERERWGHRIYQRVGLIRTDF